MAERVAAEAADSAERQRSRSRGKRASITARASQRASTEEGIPDCLVNVVMSFLLSVRVC